MRFCPFLSYGLKHHPLSYLCTTNQFSRFCSVSVSGKSKRTPLVDYITTTVKARGPLTIPQYIRETLTNEKFGYYTSKDNVIGTKGDFITAPEISQMFGELIGIWIKQVADTIDPQCKSVRIIELGPGKGTLAQDMLRGIRGTKGATNPKVNLHFVEASPILRKKQAEVLQCSTELIEKLESYSDEDPTFTNGFEINNNIRVHWHTSYTMSHIAGDDPVFIVAQEFFDALPISVFEYTTSGWREVFIDLDDSPDGPHHFKYVLAKAPTVGSRAIEKNPKLTLPVTYVPKVGNRVEISFERIVASEVMANLISTRRGAGLIIDYGQNYTLSQTLRGIKEHRFEDILCEPGQLDITSDVDFSALKRLFESEKLNVHGPITQAGFLKEMGIHSRALTLLAKTDDEKKMEEIIASYQRLTDKQQMGSIYKVLGVSSSQSLYGF